MEEFPCFIFLKFDYTPDFLQKKQKNKKTKKQKQKTKKQRKQKHFLY